MSLAVTSWLTRLPEAGGAEPNFGERARGRGDDGALRGRGTSEKCTGAGKGDDVGEVFDFTAFHPAIFFEVCFGRSMGQEFLNGGQGSAAVGESDNAGGIHVVSSGPAGPYAGDGGGGIDEDAVHVNEQGGTDNLGHDSPGLVHFQGCNHPMRITRLSPQT